MKRTALIAIFILLALCLAGCGRTEIVAAEPEATPTLSVKLIAGRRSAAAETGALPRLNTQEHLVYLEPIRSGRIAPDAPITRGDACRALYTLLENPIEGACSYSDISPDDELYEVLSCLAAWGVVTDSAGEFGPADMLSRAQLVTMLSRFYPPEPGEGAEEPYVGSFRRRSADVERLPDAGIPSFEDTSGHWSSAAVENAVRRGWIEAGGKFYPNAAVTRAEFCRILNRALGRRGDEGVALLSGSYGHFRDLPVDHEDYGDVLEASCRHEFFYDGGGRECWRCRTLEPGLHRAGGRLYYVQEDGSLLRGGSVEQWEFDDSGRYTTGLTELDDIIRDILLELGTDDMSETEALRAAYLYCTHDHVYIYHNWYSYGFDDVHDEFAFRALRFFKTGGGCCYDYAAGFGLLARTLGFNCYIVKAEVNQYYAPHGFVVIPENGVNYIYDPELESARPWRHVDFDLFRITNGSIYNYWYTPWW